MATYETYETEEDYDTMAEPNVNEATPTVRLKISFPYCFFFNLCSFVSNFPEHMKQIINHFQTRPCAAVLACAPSNSAADLLAERLLDIVSPSDLAR